MSAPAETARTVVEAIEAAARDLPARRQRHTVTQLLDERVSFEDVGSLTDRARLREQVMTRLTDSGQRRERGRRGWSR